MDPDIVSKVPYSAKAADIWACGVILYVLYTGKVPFYGEFQEDLFRKIKTGKFTKLPVNYDSTLKQLLRKIF